MYAVTSQCKKFIADYKSDHINCFTCQLWDREEFVCRDDAYLQKRDREIEMDGMNRMMRSSRTIVGLL